MKQANAPVAAKLLQSLLALAKLSTMRGKYGSLKPGPDGRIRTTLSVVGTETGRLSSSGSFLEESTNLQVQTKKVAMLDQLYNTRKCFVPDRGKAFIEGDLKGAEAFATAAFSEDDALLERMAGGEDIHKWTAGHIFSKPPESINKQERFLGKVARHALNYGMGWKTFMETVNKDADLTGITVTAGEARRIVTAYHSLHPRLSVWWDSIGSLLGTKGFLTNPFGRRRDFFGRRGSHETLKEAIAFLPQSTIADLLNWRLCELYDRERRGGFQILLQIHDAVLLQAPIATSKGVAALVKNTIETTIEINFRQVRIPCEVSMSEVSWADMEAL